MMTIVQIQEKDLPSFVSLWNQEFEVLTSCHFQMTLARAKKGFQAKMFLYHGIYNNDKLVGFMLLKEDGDFWIKHMLIDKDLRRKGYGGLFLKKAGEIAKNGNFKLKTEVVAENKEAK